MFKGLKRKISGFLAILMFTFGVFSGYPQPVEAAMESSVLYALEAILETVGLSMGYSYSSTSDLEQASRGLQYYGQNSAVDSSAWDSLYDLIFENHIPDSADMAAMQLNTAEIDFLRDYLGLQMALGVSSYSGTTSNEQIVYQNSLPDDFYTRFFSGCSVYVPDGCTLNASFDRYMNRGLIASKVVTPNVVTNDYGFTTYLYVPEGVPAFLVDNKDGTVQVYDANGQLIQFVYFQFDKKELSSSVVTSNYSQWAAGSTDYRIVPAYTGWAVHYTTYFDSLDLSQGYMIYSTFPVFSSVDQYAAYVESSQFYPVADRIVGSVDTVIGLKTGEDGLVTVPVTPSVTEQVQEAIEAATSDGVTLTDEQLDQIAAAVIAGISDTTEDPPSEDGNSGILSGIAAIVSAILAAVQAIQDLFSDLLEAVMDIPRLFDSASDLFIGKIFTSFDSILDYCSDYLSIFQALPQDIADVLTDVFPAVKPIDFLEVFNQAFDLDWSLTTFPALTEILDWTKTIFPSIPDILEVLSGIAASLERFFALDLSAISFSATSFYSVWNEHFPVFGQISDLFSNLSFPDTYSYPVIRVQTPAVLRPYYNSDYIILLDFADYAAQFGWCRNIVSAMLWVGFFYSLTRHFRVKFHIG